MKYEYLAVPAPSQMKKVKGPKTAVERLAMAMTDAINEMADEGWEYLRTETLTVEDKAHRLAKIVERIETVMIFRRPQDYEERMVDTRSIRQTPQPQPIARQVEEPANTAAPKPQPLIRRERREPEVRTTSELVEEKSPALGGATRD